MRNSERVRCGNSDRAARVVRGSGVPQKRNDLHRSKTKRCRHSGIGPGLNGIGTLVQKGFIAGAVEVFSRPC